MEMINKKELIKEVATKMELTQKSVAEVIDCFVETIGESLVKGNTVKISGFVTLEPQVVEARAARNPKTGDTVEVPAHNRVKVKVSKTLKDIVR